MKNACCRMVSWGFCAVALALFSVSCTTSTQGPASRTGDAAGSIGYFTCDEEHFTFELACDGKPVRISGVAGDRMEVPVGTHRLYFFRFEQKADDGARWEIMGSAPGTPLPPVGAGETVALEFGPPLKPKLEVMKSGNDLSFRIAVTGVGGEYYPVFEIQREHSMVSPPGVEIRDASGKLLAEGRFRYG